MYLDASLPISHQIRIYSFLGLWGHWCGSLTLEKLLSKFTCLLPNGMPSQGKRRVAVSSSECEPLLIMF